MSPRLKREEQAKGRVVEQWWESKERWPSSDPLTQGSRARRRWKLRRRGAGR